MTAEHGQMTGGAVEDATAAPEADIVAELTGRVGVPGPSPAASDTPADAPTAATDNLPDPDPQPLFGGVSEEKVEPQPTDKDEEKAEELVAKADLSTEDATALQEFADKHYQGSIASAIKGIYETKSSNAKLHGDLTSLRNEFQSFVAGFNEEPDDDTPATSTDVEEFDDTIKGLNSEVADLRKSHMTTLGTINEVSHEIASVMGEMKRASEDEQIVLTARRDRLEDRKETLVSKLDDLDSRYSSRQSEISRAEKAKGRAQKAADTKRTRDREGRKHQETQDGKVEAYFAELVSKEAGSLAMDNTEAKEMHGAVRIEMLDYLKDVPPGGPTVDMAAFVQARAAAYVKRQEEKATKLLHRRTAAKKPGTPAKRTAAPALKPGTPTKDPTLNTRSGRWTADFARQRAGKVLGE